MKERGIVPESDDYCADFIDRYPIHDRFIDYRSANVCKKKDDTARSDSTKGVKERGIVPESNDYCADFIDRSPIYDRFIDYRSANVRKKRTTLLVQIVQKE